jgi:hypothetical protein
MPGGDDGDGDMQGIGERFRFRSHSSPLSNSSTHLLLRAFLVHSAGSGVVRDGEGTAGGVVGLGDLEAAVSGR